MIGQKPRCEPSGRVILDDGIECKKCGFLNLYYPRFYTIINCEKCMTPIARPYMQEKI